MLVTNKTTLIELGRIFVLFVGLFHELFILFPQRMNNVTNRQLTFPSFAL